MITIKVVVLVGLGDKWKKRNVRENIGIRRDIHPIYRDWKEHIPIIEGKGNLYPLYSFPQGGGDRYRTSNNPE